MSFSAVLHHEDHATQLVSQLVTSIQDNLTRNLTQKQPHALVHELQGEHNKHSSVDDLDLLGPNWQIFLIALYTLTAALALIGNVVAIWVLTYGKRSSRELRLFLVNLSLSDIMMALFSIPFTYTDFMLGRWVSIITR
jgi:hypothetical protein